MAAELVVAERESGWRRADDPVPRRHQAGLGEVEMAGKQLAPARVSGPAEQQDHVVVRSQGRVHVRASSNGGQGNRPKRPPAGEPRATGVIGRPAGWWKKVAPGPAAPR